MPPPVIRPVRRSDRDQLTALINAHVAAVIPNMSLSVSTVMSSLEREPGEFIEDPWVVERLTLVAEQRSRVSAAVHLIRYADSDGVPAHTRGAVGLRWMLFWPDAPFWPDSSAAARELLIAALARAQRWRATTVFADGTLPAPGVYGISHAWPHIIDLLRDNGFRRRGQVEDVLVATVGALAGLPATSSPIERRLGVSGTRFTLIGPEGVRGYLEIDTTLDVATQTSRLGEWADVGNFHLAPGVDRREVGTALLGAAGRWLDLGRAGRLLDYAVVGEVLAPVEVAGIPTRAGDDWYAELFTPLARCDREWVLGATSAPE